MKFLTAAALASAAAVASAFPSELFTIRPDETVKALDVNAYAGRWYQTYANAAVMNTFEKDNVCVTADYSLKPDGKVAVLNQARLKSPTGEKTTITGEAVQSDPAAPGKLTVSLEGTPFPAPYWIMSLGPVVNGKYEWALVADSAYPLGTLFILARDLKTFAAKYEKDALARANELGFNNFANKPIKTLQEGCTYSEEVESLSRPDETVKALDVNAYAGRWYQMYANAAVMNTFEKDNVCVTADYTLKPDGKVGVLNQARLKTVDGEKTVITGEAVQNDPAVPGKLTVSLEGTPFPAPYWIMGLGPVVNGKYQWAVVADSAYPLGTLFILGRDRDGFRANYEKDALARANELGFNNFANKPIKTLQDGCSWTF